MTGGGFGGCTVNLIAPDRVEAFEAHISEAYRRAFAKEPTIYPCQPAAGAGEVL
jgi:galactokinase